MIRDAVFRIFIFLWRLKFHNKIVVYSPRDFLKYKSNKSIKYKCVKVWKYKNVYRQY